MNQLCLFFSFILGEAVPSQAISPSGPIKVTTVENMMEYRWPNGLKALLYPDPSSSKITVNMTVLVGSRHEGYGETGMAHLLEHMLFKPTKLHPDIPKALRDRGATFNGTTWVDRTNYYETLNAGGDNLEMALRLESDRLVNSLIRREDLLSEFSVVRNEFERGENDPERVLSQRMMSAAFEWHNYGKSTIGNRTDIERVPIDNLQAFYRKYYRPDNTILILAGAIKEAEAVNLISKYYGNLKNPETPLPQTYTEEPPQDGEREVILRRVGKVAATGLLYHIPSGAHADYAAIEVLATALAIQPSGPIYKAVVGGKVGSDVSTMAFGWHDPGALEIGASALSGVSASKLREVLVETINKLIKDGIDSASVDRAKQQLQRSRELLMGDGNRVAISLSDWASKGDWRLFFLHRDRIAKVTKADVDKVLREYLVRSNRTTGLFDPVEKPERAAIPVVNGLATTLKDYKGGKGVKLGEQFEPSYENIFNRAQFGAINEKVRYALLSKKSRNEQVTVRVSLGFGNEEALKGTSATANLLPQIMRRGTKTMSRQQMEDTLSKLKAQIIPQSGPGSLGFSVIARREVLPQVLSLLTEIIRDPSFVESEFEVLKNQAREGLVRGMSEPMPLAQRALLRTLFPYPDGDVRKTPTIEESLENNKKLSLEGVKKLYTEQLGAEDVELVAVGDFDPDLVKGFLAKLTTDWQAKTPFKRIEFKAFPDLAGSKQVINTPDKANAFYLAGFSLGLRDDDPNGPTLELANFLLGGGTLSSRLGNRVRQKEGLAYGVNSNLTIDNKDYLSRWLIFASCNPTAIVKVEKAIGEEVEKVTTEGFTPTEIAEGSKALLAEAKNGRASDSGVVAILVDALEAKRGVDFYLNQDKKLVGLDTKEVNTVIKTYLLPKRLIIVEAGDFAKKK